MGQYADDLIDNCWNDYDDYFKNIRNYEELPSVKKAKIKIGKVRRELKLLYEKKKSEGDINPLNNARQEINLKYGKGWRERGLTSDPNDQW